MNIIGTYECKIDSNGRLMLPSAIKKQLSEIIDKRFIIKRNIFYKCLELYPMKEWENEIEGVNNLNRFVKKNSDFIRGFMAGVKIIELDRNGRLLIPRDLIKFSEIKKDIVLSSSINRIEIWDKTKYEESISKIRDNFSALAEEVMGKINNTDLQDDVP